MEKKKVHLIMPMGGAGSRFAKEGFNLPKPLIKINNKPFFYWATKSVSKFIDLVDITFVILKQHIEEFEIDKAIKEYFPNAKLVVIPEMFKEGPVLTCKEGIKDINDELPIIFNDCDQMFKCSKLNDYCNKGEFDACDAALLTFNSDSPKFSYVQFDEYGNVIKTVEKEVVSNQAICGAYYFKNTETFKNTLDTYIKNCNYSELFVSGLYNVMLEQGKKIITFEVDKHIPYGTPAEYEIAKNSTFFKELE